MKKVYAKCFRHWAKPGGVLPAQLEAMCRLITVSLRSGVDPASVVKQLRGYAVRQLPGKAANRYFPARMPWQRAGKHINGETEPENAEKKEILKVKQPPKRKISDWCGTSPGSAPNAAAYWPTRKAVLFAPNCGYTKC